MSKLLNPTCKTMEVLEKELKENPELSIKMIENEESIKKWIETYSPELRLIDGVITIPVVVNVLYRTAYEKISQRQILSQIDVLNEDFNGANEEFALIPEPYVSKKADVGIRFYLDSVNRKPTTKRFWPLDDSMKKLSLGGIDPTTPTVRLNIWVCTLEGNALGYAKFPGGNPLTDGIVILNSAFGSREKYPQGYYQPNYDKGRTTTHEMGHWLNLYHPWGGTNIPIGDDLVEDTPPQSGPSYDCFTMPTGSTVQEPKLNINYMDYLPDSCMWMFTNGQKERMLATFSPTGPRASFVKSL